MTKNAFNILILGQSVEYLPSELTSQPYNFIYEKYDMDKLLEPYPQNPQIILCLSQENLEISFLEVAQTLRMNYPDQPIIFIATDKKMFDKRNLVKNGFSDAFILPWEKVAFLRSLKEIATYSMMPELKDYINVQVLDLAPGIIMNFSTKIYLPMNQKIVVFAREGEAVSEQKIRGLKENDRNTILVHKEDMKKFYEYTAEVLKNAGKTGGISETERKAKLENCVRELVSDMFISNDRENTFGKSQQLLKDFREILKLMMSDQQLTLLDKTARLVNTESDFYTHLSNVSVYCTIFGMALGLEKLEELAIAGLLHDIGMTNFPKELAGVSYEDLSPLAQEAYQKHPIHTIDVCRMKRMPLSDKLVKVIMQHHERMDGTGYPNKVRGESLLPESKVLAIADRFDYLTSVRPGKENYTPLQALDLMIQENTQNPSDIALDRDLLRTLLRVFTGGAAT